VPRVAEDVSDYSALLEVGRSLVALIWSEIRDDPVFQSIISSETQITLTSPDDLTEDQKLSLFLYYIVEDSFKRNLEVGLVDTNNRLGQPIPLRLYYMIIPNTKDGEKDQLLLGKVVEIFNDHRILRDPFLNGGLAGGMLKLIFHTPTPDDINRIWSVVSRNKPYVLAVYYQVFPVRIDSEKSEEIKRVSDVEYVYERLDEA